MKRTDFRPNNTFSSLTDKQKATIKSKYGERIPRASEQPLGVKDRRSIGSSNTDKVINAFINNEKRGSENDNIHSDGKRLYSYDTVIATRQSDGTVVLNKTKYSATTNKQQQKVERELKRNNIKYDVTGDKPYRYEGEDFSKENKSESHIKDKYKNHNIDLYYSEKDDEYKVYVDGNFTRTMSTKENATNYAKTYIDSEFKNDSNTGKLSLSDIKYRNERAGQYFFSPSTMRMYRQVNAKYRTKYDKKTDTNYVVVNMKKYPESSDRKDVVYKFNKENNHLDYVKTNDL